jgi:hypothetical protein
MAQQRLSTQQSAQICRGCFPLLSGQSSDGGFGVHYYRKWTGAHWRLVSLAEFEVPAQEPRTVAAAESVLRYFEPA